MDTFSNDPITQLRQTCKKIVIWLRTLYCWSRMLPSQGLRGATIGFSIYVVSEGNDDVTSLMQNQGFMSQSQPAGVVTPYGQLGWKVFYATSSMIEPLLSQHSPYKTKTQARPISIPQSPNNPKREHFRRDSAPNVVGQAQSAPTNRKIYQRSNSAAGVVSHHSPQYQKPTTMRSNSGVPDSLPMSRIDSGVELSLPSNKNLSGLSLAMMMTEEAEKSSQDASGNNSSNNNEQAGKRRAALHHAPPQLPNNNTNSATPSEQQQHLSASPAAVKKGFSSAGEYGYAYNSHIPWQKIHPSNNNAMTSNNRISPADQERTNTASPSPFHVGTPPTGHLLGATPPTGAGFLMGHSSPSPINPSTLIPPRNAVTPPFTRAMGFAASGEPPTQPLPPPAMGTEYSNSNPTTPAPKPPGAALDARPATSLDILHSSPFQHPSGGASLLSSLTGAQDPINANSILSGDMRFQTEMAFEDHNSSHLEDGEDMPFAVDTLPPATTSGSSTIDDIHTTTGGGSSSSHLGASSAAVASFAHRCATANRLALFDKTAEQQNAGSQQEDLVSSLADQLAEFKEFGASIGVSTGGKSGSETPDAGASTSTPISLRT